MSRWLVLALALGGCDQVFGLETVEPVASTVTGTYRYRTVFNDANYEPMTLERILDVGSFKIEAFLDDGTETPVDYKADGSFSFPVGYPGQAYQFSVTVEGNRFEWQHDASQLNVANYFAGRPDRRPVSATYVRFNYPTLAGTARVASTGIYTYSDTGMVGPTVNFDWRLATSIGSGIIGMLDAAEFDRAYAVELESSTEGGSPSTYTRVHAVSSASISQVTNMTAMLPQPQAVPPDTCVHIVVDSEAERLRINSAHPRTYYQSSADWIAFAAPAPEFVGLNGALYPASGGLTPQSLDIMPPFHNPYPGTTLVVEAATATSFYVQLGAAAAVGQSNVTRVYQIANRAELSKCNSVVNNLQPTVALVGKFELDDLNLTSDNTEVTLDPLRSPTLTWEVLAAGPVDLVTVSLMEVQAINNATTLIPKWSAFVVGSSVRIDRAQLEKGRTYIVNVTANLGRPNAAAGDLITLKLPIESSTIWTHTFVVR